MIHVLVGKKSKELDKALQSLVSSYPQRELVHIDAAHYEMSLWYEQIFQESLFQEPPLFLIRNLEESQEAYDFFFKQGPRIATSSAECIVMLPSLLAADKKNWEKFSTVTVIKDTDKKTPSYNSFALTNAFATGDRKKAWVTFQETLHHDDEMEKIHGLLWWKLKDMYLKKGPYSRDQLHTMAQKLVMIYAEARTAGLEIKEGLEKFFLELPPLQKK